MQERRIIAFGSMALLLAMLFGPWMLAAAVAVAEASSQDIQNAAGADPMTTRAAARTSVTRFAEISPSRQVDTSAAPSPLTPPAPAVAPALDILFPLPDAAQTGVVNLSARISKAAAVALIFSVRDGADGTRNFLAAPAGDGEVWNAAFEGEPGDYVLSVRASLADGFVQSFTEQRAFRILAATGTTETTQDAP